MGREAGADRPPDQEVRAEGSRITTEETNNQENASRN